MAAHTIALITGANTGLGLAIVKSLLQSSNKTYTILLGGRNLEKATDAAQQVKEEFPDSRSVVTPVQIDVEDDQSIKSLFERLEKDYGRVDVLVNNAGSQFDQKLFSGELTMRQMWNKSWDVNVTGTYILTYTLIPLLLKSSDPRLLFITSGAATLAESTNQAVRVNHSPPDKGWPKAGGGFAALGVPAYRASKTGLNMVMREWVKMLKADNVKVWCVSPGLLATGLGFGDPERLKQMGALDPSVGAGVVRDVVEGKRDEDVGCVVRKDGIQPW